MSKDKPKYTAKLWDMDRENFKWVCVWKVFKTGGEAIVSDEVKSVRRRVDSAFLSSFTLVE